MGKRERYCRYDYSLQQELLSQRENEGDEENISRLQGDLDTKNKELIEAQGENPLVYPHVSGSLCANVIADWTGIPIGSMVKDEAQTLLNMENLLGERVKGQDVAIGEISSTIRSAKTGMTNPDAPLGVFLCTGPSGVGKTELAMALADLLFGGEKFTTIINMSEYQEKHTVSQLKGSPPGYVGYGEGGVLTEGVRQKPYSIVILDEVEKAHRDVLNMFYQVFDKGSMRDGEGRDINFQNTAILMTSNLGSETILQACSEENIDSTTLIEAIRPELTAHFQPALLARCKIVPFIPLSPEVMKDIVRLKMDKIVKRLMDTHDAECVYGEELVDAIAQQCSTVETGARNIDTIIDGTLLPTLSQYILTQVGAENVEGLKIKIGNDESGQFSISFGDD